MRALFTRRCVEDHPYDRGLGELASMMNSAVYI
jgi:hypothetical protein